MTLTRGQVIDRVVSVTGNTDTDFRTYLEGSVDNKLFYLWDCHDWEFRHKSGTFNTVSGTESYDLSVSTPDIRSSRSLEVLYDKTNGRFLRKVDLKNIRKGYPKEDTSNQPIVYAPWGSKTIVLHDEPNAILNMKYLYLSKPTLPTADANNLETTCGLPDYIHHLLYEMTLCDGFLHEDDSRYNAKMTEIEKLLLPRAIAADMQDVESNARFKFWDEELSQSGLTFDDFLRRSWWGDTSDLNY